MSLYLTPEEVRELTDKATGPAQARRLQELGIPFIYKPPGRVKVARCVVPHLAAQAPPAANQEFAPEPDFSMFAKSA